jgi:hypothetical protein
MRIRAIASRYPLRALVFSAAAALLIGGFAADALCSQTIRTSATAPQANEDSTVVSRLLHPGAKPAVDGERSEFTDLLDYTDLGFSELGW